MNQHTYRGPTARSRIAPPLFAIAALIVVALSWAGPARAEGSAPADCGSGPNRLCTEKLGSGYSNTAGKVFWTINVTNPTAQTGTATVKDCPDNFHTCATAPFATLESITGGACPSGDLQAGLDCTVPAGATLAIKVSTPLGNAIRCNSVEFANAADILQTSPTIIAPKSSPGTSQEIPANGSGSDCEPNPAIHITKTPSTTTLPADGGAVTYTYQVSNPGNVALTNVAVVDDKCAPVTFVSGDTADDGVLGTAETWTYTCAATLTATTTNTATATAMHRDQAVHATASATVVVADAEELHQSLTVRKVVVPASDSGRFNLLIDGTAVASSVGNNGAGTRDVAGGEHTIGESAAAGTDLSKYTTTFSANCANGVVTVSAGQDATCTITNTRKAVASDTPTATATPIFPTPVSTPNNPTATPTNPPSTTPVASTPTKTPTSIVLGERTPGPTPAPPSTGNGSGTDSWFHSGAALTVIAIFLASALLSGLVVARASRREEQ